MTQAKKLIEVAMPIKEISAESVRDKSIRHGHISTLHLWWARRPLPVCRAVVFASLVPDPLDENCPQAFRDAVELLLGKKNNIGDPYHPYIDIPWTSVFDPMEDNLRNRLQMFIGKFTEDMQQHLLHQKAKPGANNQLNDFSLIKWDNKNNEAIIKIARKLIWVAHNSKENTTLTAIELIADFDASYTLIKDAETQFYSRVDRHIDAKESKELDDKLQSAIQSFLNKMPKVFDPFAGGGAIPLEAARLGCRSFGNDINPVAHIIQKGSVEFPQRYGKPITYSKNAFINQYSETEWRNQPQENKKIINGEAIEVTVTNRLSFDVAFYAKKLLIEAEKEIGNLYPPDENGNKPNAYYWARIGVCNNPSCKAEIPLLKSFYLANTSNRKIYLNPKITGNKIDFEIVEGVYNGELLKGWIDRGNLSCPCCGSITENSLLKQQLISKNNKERLLAIIATNDNSRQYRLPNQNEIDIIEKIFVDFEIPSEKINTSYTKAMAFCLWGFDKWGQLFSPRQLISLQTLVDKLCLIKEELVENLGDYGKAIITYLSYIVDKSADYNSCFCTWHPGREVIGHVFTRQAIPMVFDYPEVYPFTKSSGGIPNMIDWIVRYINSEVNEFWSIPINSSSGDKSQFKDKYLTAVITDPPYYDAIAYADLSDFFYIWLKRSLSDIYPLIFATPQTPKSEECTALKHHHGENKQKAKQHFEGKLTEIFEAIEHQTSDIVSIMFAHQSTEAWTTLCNAVLDSQMNITGSWPMDTEMTNRSVGLAGAALESSVTVSCRPSQRSGIANYRTVKKSIENTVEKQVSELYKLGFRGADLLTACFGQAVSEFGKYEKVEKADGSEVTVADLLEMARESAFNALLKGFEGDECTKFYIAWLQLYGFAESDFDDAAKFSRVGLSIDVQELFAEHILIKNESGNKQTLGGFEQRIHANKNIGEKVSNLLIDEVHRAMALYKGTNRAALLQYLSKVASKPESSFWRVLTSLNEVLPAGSDDHKQATGLITNKESLIRESKTIQATVSEQTKMFE